jgi:prepilin-type N-terminal cleavage/methylation domain-containing protein
MITKNLHKRRGYTLIELIVATGLFAVIMTLVSTGYFMMISITQKAQGTASGINNLSFVLETMTRTIRTGTNYTPLGSSSFSVTNSVNGSPKTYIYSWSDGVVYQNDSALTDPSVNITNLSFTVSGENDTTFGDYQQPYVVIVIEGTTSTKSGSSENFSLRTSAVMRSPDL